VPGQFYQTTARRVLKLVKARGRAGQTTSNLCLLQPRSAFPTATNATQETPRSGVFGHGNWREGPRKPFTFPIASAKKNPTIAPALLTPLGSNITGPMMVFAQDTARIVLVPKSRPVRRQNMHSVIVDGENPDETLPGSLQSREAKDF